MSANTSELIERELRERAEWRSQNEGPFTKVNLIEWRAADHIRRLLGHIAELESALAFADKQAVKVEALLEPHIVWKNPAPDASAPRAPTETVTTSLAARPTEEPQR